MTLQDLVDQYGHVGLLEKFRYDFPLYAEYCLKIRTFDATLIPFKLNRVQRYCWNKIAEDLNADKPVRYIYLKARQEGISTFCEGIGFWKASLNRFVHGLVTAHENDPSKEIFTMIHRFYDFCPEWVKPLRKRSNAFELLFQHPRKDSKDPGLHSKIKVATARNKNIGIGGTLQFVHASEVARFEEVNADIKSSFAALRQAVPDIPETFILLESTAKGHDYFKSLWDNEENEYTKVFISWLGDPRYCDETPIDLNSLEGKQFAEWGNELEMFGVIKDELKFWYPEEKYEQNPDKLQWDALRRLAWRRKKIKAEFDDDIILFGREYPTTPKEAFALTSDSVFPYQIIQSYRSIEKEPVHRYTWNVDGGILKKHPKGPISVFEYPEPNTYYAIGADPTENIRDKAGFQILKLGPMFEQVVRGYLPIDPDDFGSLLYKLGHMYNTAIIGIETNGAGTGTQLKLQKKPLSYPRLFRRKTLDHAGGGWTNKLGWYSSGSSKPVMIYEILAKAKQGTLAVIDPLTINQMETFVQKDNGKLEGEGENPDELVDSLAIAIQTGKQFFKLNVDDLLIKEVERNSYLTMGNAVELDKFDNREHEVGFVLPSKEEVKRYNALRVEV